MSIAPYDLATLNLESLEEQAGFCTTLLEASTGYHRVSPEDDHQHPLLDGDTRQALEDRRDRLTAIRTRLRRALGLPSVGLLEVAGEYATTGTAGMAARA